MLPPTNVPKPQMQVNPTETRDLSKRREVPALGENPSPEKQGALLTAVKEADQDSIELMRETLNATRASLGSTHPSTLTAMNNLASLLQDNGMLEDAEALFRECLQARRQTLGDRDPSTVTSINNLGMLLHDAGWTMAVGEADEKLLDEATTLLREALEARRDVVGSTHPDTLDSIYNLGRLLQDRGMVDEALSLLREELNGAAAHKGVAHEETIGSAENLVKLLTAAGRADDAKAITAEYQLGKDAKVTEPSP